MYLPQVPAAVVCRIGARLAARLETRVGRLLRLLPIFDANQPRLFGKVEKSGFASILKQLRIRQFREENARPGGPRTPRPRAGSEPAAATDRSPFLTNTAAKSHRTDA
jgi:hypothetical protein